MNVLSLAAVLASGAFMSGPIDVERTALVIEERVEIRAASGEVTSGWQRTEISEGRLRRETSASPTVLLLDATGPIAVAKFDPAARSWFGFEPDLLAEHDLAGPLLEGIGITANGAIVIAAEPFRATGRSRRIGSWDAREMASTTRGPGGVEVRQWLADEPDGLSNTAVLSILERIFGHPDSRWASYFATLAAQGGFPVRTVRRYPTASGVHVVTITVTSIRKVPLRPERFRIPDDMRRTGDPLGLTPATR